MKIFMTGASGFLGTHLARRLEKDGHQVTKTNSSNCDLTDQTSLAPFSTVRYDQIFHLAAWTQAGDFCLRHPGEQWLINQKINTNLLDWWAREQRQARLVTIGTSCSYPPDRPLCEENYLTGTPDKDLFTYAMTKRMLYAGQLALHKQYDLEYLCFVPSTLYGTGYHSDGRQMHFIFDIIRKILRGKYRGEPVILWGDGYQKRELIYVNDFIHLMLEINQKHCNDLINIGAGEEFTIRYFAQLICEYVGFEFEKIQFDTSRYIGVQSKCLYTQKIQKLIPGLNTTPLEIGLAATIDWLSDQPAILNTESPLEESEK